MDFAAANVVVLVTPAKDLPGQWIAHCLNVDLITQGTSIQDAFTMAREALSQVVADDIQHNLNPLDRPPAPQECWERMNATLRDGRPMPTIADASKIASAVAFVTVTVPRAALPAPAHPPPTEVALIPPAWQIAALRDLQNVPAHC